MIRSLSRGLDIVMLLNRRDSASAGELAHELDIPRATVYRILETLSERDLVRQHDSDQRYRITPGVRALSAGFTDDDHMAHISRRHLHRVTKKLNWPVALATISGIDVIVRENTDQISPLSLEKFSSGYRMKILHTASGICILANMKRGRREVILDTLQQTQRDPDSVAKERAGLERKMREVRRKGFAVHHRSRLRADLTAMAVPIIPEEDQVRGAVAIRYARSAIKLQSAIDLFLPELTRAAADIGQRVKLHYESRAS